MYKIYKNGQYKKWTNTRDQALTWINSEVRSGGGDFEEFEILDRSDEEVR
jgi:hypothetical protein